MRRHVMSSTASCPAWISSFEIGVILSATPSQGAHLPRTVRIGQGGKESSALAFDSAELEAALQAPLRARQLHRAHTGSADTPPLLLERSEEHTSELQSLMRISYAVFCLKKKNSILIMI